MATAEIDIAANHFGDLIGANHCGDLIGANHFGDLIGAAASREDSAVARRRRARQVGGTASRRP